MRHELNLDPKRTAIVVIGLQKGIAAAVKQVPGKFHFASLGKGSRHWQHADSTGVPPRSSGRQRTQKASD
jgi:hypothetical protein